MNRDEAREAAWKVFADDNGIDDSDFSACKADIEAKHSWRDGFNAGT